MFLYYCVDGRFEEAIVVAVVPSTNNDWLLLVFVEAFWAGFVSDGGVR